MTVWRWERAGVFPRRVRIGSNTVAWPESEVAAWCEARVAERDMRQKEHADMPENPSQRNTP